MWQYRTIYSLLISFVLSSSFVTGVKAQAMYPSNQGDKVRYAAMIETPKAYLSGICILYHDENDEIRGSFFNEFGISALDFSYDEEKDKVKLHHVIMMMDKWYIRKVLRRDLRELIHQLKLGNGCYRDKRYRLDYQFTPVSND